MVRATPLASSRRGSATRPLLMHAPPRISTASEAKTSGCQCYGAALRGLGAPMPLVPRRRPCGITGCRAVAGPRVAEEVAPAAEEQLEKTQEIEGEELSEFRRRRIRRQVEKKREALVYQMAAVGATFLVSSMAIVATYLRYHYIMEGQEVNWIEIMASLSLVCGGVAGMEMYARWAHKHIWHDMEAAWALHKSHHEPRTGPFELNDIYAVANAVPAISLCAYGFITPGTPGGICWGLGLGITLYGMMYMFVHDGLVHKRFPVGPIANVPYLKRVAAAHKMHHIDDFDGLPWGLFLGEQELEGNPKALEQLEQLVALGDRSEI
eukprot:evm.model.scf_66EXC.1 EVM.evm.TU.scf_66EXC.1   scf_66EXC:28594-32890(+)